MAESMLEVTDSTWDAEVVDRISRSSWLICAPWCGPCRVMDPILDELAGQHAGRVKFTKLNVDDNFQMAARYDILDPTVMVFEGGQMKKLIGALPRRRIEEELSTLLGASSGASSQRRDAREDDDRAGMLAQAEPLAEDDVARRRRDRGELRRENGRVSRQRRSVDERGEADQLGSRRERDHRLRGLGRRSVRRTMSGL